MNAFTSPAFCRAALIHAFIGHSHRTDMFRRSLAMATLLAGLTIPQVSADDLIPTISTRLIDGKTLATFTQVGTGTWTIPDHTGDVEVLVVGGGGAAGSFSGGGGGGGFLNWSGPLAAGVVTVTVGDGGVGGNYRTDSGTYPNGTRAPNGGQSAFDTLTAEGGEGGIFVWTSSGAGYGWGGKSGVNNTNSVGGLVADLPSGAYGSGSGVGVKGTAAGANNDAGGAGLSSTISGSTVWYGGGGGAVVNGPGGQGGGGAGGNPPVNGTANRGGGGGSGWGVNGGSGGSGVVIIAYTTSTKTLTTTTLESSDNPSVAGQSVTCTATVMVGGVPATAATGTYEFKVDDVVVEPSAAIASGVASFTTSALSAGNHTITATYSGDDDYETSANSITQAMLPVITPDTETTRGDGFTVATFTTVGSGIWIVPSGVTSVEVLVIGGGGGGGCYGGGGGGGGFLSVATHPVTAGSPLGIAVGDGGAGGTDPGARNPGAAGGNSVFDSLIAYGGGGGSWVWGPNNGIGGTSGANNTDSVGGLAADVVSGVYGSGSGVGVKGTAASNSEPGGAGLSSSITGSAVGYGGGGGSIVNGPGGFGGGGKGGNPAVVGTANTGGGGGGGWGVNGAAGGSGVVIVAYQISISSPYLNWVASFPGFNTDTGPTLDPDGDGMTNQQEFAFGLDPTSGTSVNPISDMSDFDTLGQFTYTRYAASGLTYSVWTSTDLKTWEIPGTVTEQAGEPVDGVETVLVEIIPPPSGDTMFIRVGATEAAP